jgi:tetratricopeptide (TPR) repeat protein
MDPTTLLAAVLIAVGLLGTDAVIYSGSVQVEVAAPPDIKGVAIDRSTLEVEFDARLNEVAQTASVVRPPEMRSSAEQGLGMALAEAANVQNVAFALQSSFGYDPDRMRFSLYTDNGQLKALVSGGSHHIASFSNVMTPEKDEPLLAFVQRCALWGVSELAPYQTTLYLLQQHAADGNFADVTDDRALFENILGLVALFKNDKQTARDEFDKAMRSDPTDPVPFLNAGFTDLQFDENQRAVDRMTQLIRLAPPQNKVLLATAYFTLGASYMGLKDLKHADRALAEAVQINPESSSALHLWSEEKGLEGDKAASERLGREALAQTATFENYAEVAALYFHLSWGDNEPVTRSQFANPGVVSFH